MEKIAPASLARMLKQILRSTQSRWVRSMGRKAGADGKATVSLASDLLARSRSAGQQHDLSRTNLDKPAVARYHAVASQPAKSCINSVA